MSEILRVRSSADPKWLPLVLEALCLPLYYEMTEWKQDEVVCRPADFQQRRGARAVRELTAQAQ
jgi:hypothetical protein